MDFGVEDTAQLFDIPDWADPDTEDGVADYCRMLSDRAAVCGWLGSAPNGLADAMLDRLLPDGADPDMPVCDRKVLAARLRGHCSVLRALVRLISTGWLATPRGPKWAPQHTGTHPAGELSETVRTAVLAAAEEEVSRADPPVIGSGLRPSWSMPVGCGEAVRDWAAQRVGPNSVREVGRVERVRRALSHPRVGVPTEADPLGW